MFTVISHVTLNTPYEQEVKGLVESLKLFKIPYFIYYVKDLGNWRKNLDYKQTCIASALIKYPDSDIVYLDADARVRKFPKLFNVIQADLGVHYKDGWELLNGTMFIKNNLAAREFITKWCSAEQDHTVLDQKVLQRLLESDPHISVFELPASYTQIFDSMQHHGEPVIEHMQASRRFKRVINVCKTN